MRLRQFTTWGLSILFGIALAIGACKRPPTPAQGPTPAASKLVVDLPQGTPDERVRNAHRVWPWVQRYARRYGLDPQLVLAVIWVESRYEIGAKSHAGARGLMQLMPATARALRKKLKVAQKPLTDPEHNIQLGCYYLARLLRRFKGRQDLALASYNAGPTRIAKIHRKGKKLPDYAQSYIRLVLKARRYFPGSASS